MWEAELITSGYMEPLLRETGRRTTLTAFTDGAGQLKIERIVNKHYSDPPSKARLFGDDYPAAVTILDRDELRARWFGLFAKSLDEPIPGIVEPEPVADHGELTGHYIDYTNSGGAVAGYLTLTHHADGSAGISFAWPNRARDVDRRAKGNRDRVHWIDRGHGLTDATTNTIVRGGRNAHPVVVSDVAATHARSA
jgi:hypothetical protein